MAKNLLAELVIAALRQRDTHTHRNIKFITINEDAVRHIFETDEYLSGLSAEQHDALNKKMEAAQAARQKAEEDARKKAEAERKQAAKIRQKRIDEKIKQEEQKERERKNRIADSRKATASGQDTQKTMTFHARSNMATASAAQKRRGPLPHGRNIPKEKPPAATPAAPPAAPAEK